MTDERVLHVYEYLTLVNQTMRQIPSQEFFIEGEVSDYRVSQNKWVSFDLKDENEPAVLKCFATTWQVKYPMEDGMKIRVQGYAKIYERFGTFKLNVTAVDLVGEGALRRAYELLKQKLEQEGLFDAARKRALPRFVDRIGLITSRDAAAYGDFLRILNNRWGGVEVDFTHVQVQGREAVPSILAAYRYFNALPVAERPQVLVMVRGGGGLEDLHAFNDEAVARALFQSAIPVVCGVGHERDESLCDYVADVRASTPSNAAERVVPSRAEVRYEIDHLSQFLEGRIDDAVAARAQIIEHAARSVSVLVSRQLERLSMLSARLRRAQEGWLPRLAERLESHVRLLKQLDPKRVLARGYGIVTRGGLVVRDAASLDIGAEIAIQLAAGSVDAEVLRANGKGKQRLV